MEPDRTLAPAGTLPNFFIAGVIKGGTGALHQYLSHHPEIFMTEVKEPRYFGTDGSGRLEGYMRLFEGTGGRPVRGEATSSYFHSDEALGRIKRLIPDAKILVSLRNPVDRAYAHCCMLRGVPRVDDEVLLRGRTEYWATASLYADRLSQCFDSFGRSNVHVSIFEDWARHVADELREIYRFLQVDPDVVLNDAVHYRPAVPVWGRLSQHPMARFAKRILPRSLLREINDLKFQLSRKPGSASPAARTAMYAWYRDDIERVQSILGRSLAAWTP